MPHAWCLLYIGIVIYHMTIMMYLQINDQIGRATLKPEHSFVGCTWCVMLIVEPNRDFQWRRYTPAKGMPEAKSNY